MMRRFAILLLLASPGLAQTPLRFTIDQGVSQWSWSGETDLGPLLGNPNQSFDLSASFRLQVTSGSTPLSTGQLVSGGVAFVAPDLSAQVPNPVPGLPPLATIDVTGLSLEFTGPRFEIDAAGDFNGHVVCRAQSGLLTVTPIAGTPTTTDLAGTSGEPAPFSGTITQNGKKIYVDAAPSTRLEFTEHGSGISGAFNLRGRLFGAWFAPSPANYCVAEPNSSGSPASITYGGSVLLQDRTFEVVGHQLPKDQVAYLLMSSHQAYLPGAGGSQGNLCVAEPQIRFASSALHSGSSGSVSLTPDLGNLPQGTCFQPGDGWNFQLWYRDNNPGATSNFTDGLSVIFAP